MTLGSLSRTMSHQYISKALRRTFHNHISPLCRKTQPIAPPLFIHLYFHTNSHHYRFFNAENAVVRPADPHSQEARSLETLMTRAINSSHDTCVLFSMFCDKSLKVKHSEKYIIPSTRILALYLVAKLSELQDDKARIEALPRLIAQLENEYALRLNSFLIEELLYRSMSIERNWKQFVDYLFTDFIDNSMITPNRRALIWLMRHAAKTANLPMADRLMQIYADNREHMGPLKALVNYYLECLLRANKFGDAMRFIQQNIARVPGVKYDSPEPHMYANNRTLFSLRDYLEALKEMSQPQKTFHKLIVDELEKKGRGRSTGAAEEDEEI